jgi:hypothetical protein
LLRLIYTNIYPLSLLFYNTLKILIAGNSKISPHFSVTDDIIHIGVLSRKFNLLILGERVMVIGKVLKISVAQWTISPGSALSHMSL